MTGTLFDAVTSQKVGKRRLKMLHDNEAFSFIRVCYLLCMSSAAAVNQSRGRSGKRTEVIVSCSFAYVQ